MSEMAFGSFNLRGIDGASSPGDSLLGSSPERNTSAQRESLPQIDTPYLHIVSKLMRSSGAEDPPFCNDIRPVRHTQRLAHIVIGDQHANPARPEVKDDSLQLQHGNRIDAAE